MNQTIFQILMVLNVLWFGAAFRFFWLKAPSSAKILVRREYRNSPVFQSVISALPFLGGMNLAFALLSLLLLSFSEHFQQPAALAILCTAIGAAHLTQFLGNLPMALREKRGDPAVWPVLSGPMLFIFTVDAGMAIANLGFALLIGIR